MGLLEAIFGRKKITFIKEAKIVFKEEYDDVPIDSPLLKKILIYVKGNLDTEIAYSDVIIDELKREGIPILDTTIEPQQYMPQVGIDMGKVDLS